MSEPWTTSSHASDYGKSLLVGEHVRLRPPTEDDLQKLGHWYSDPEFTTLQSGSYSITAETETLEVMKKWFSNAEMTGGANFVIEDLASGETIGGVNLFGGKLPQRAATVAIQVGGEHVGKGAGSEALALAVGFGFRELGLNRNQLDVFAYNSRAIRAYEKVGFVLEGRRRQAVFHDGQFLDSLIMGILLEDWLAARG